MKLKNISFLCLFLIVTSLDAHAEDYTGILVYSPETAELTVPAGSLATTAISIGVENSLSAGYSLSIVSRIQDGNLPKEWISASPAFAILMHNTVVNSVLGIQVPQQTLPGVYTGHLVSSAMAAHRFADPGSGIFISVKVPAACPDTGSIGIDSFGPSIIWPPGHRLNVFTVSGKVFQPAGCTMIDATYRIDDEYGIYTSSDNFTPAEDGSFTIMLPLEAWREGQDKDGRHYTVTLSVRNEAGISSSEALEVIVPHDRRGEPAE